MKQKSLSLGGEVLTEHMKECTNFLERGRGLLFRKPLEASLGQALLIPLCGSIHTFWMGYPITVLFLNKEKRLLRICPSVRPWRFAAQKKAAFVIECAVDTPWVDRLAVDDVLAW